MLGTTFPGGKVSGIPGVDDGTHMNWEKMHTIRKYHLFNKPPVEFFSSMLSENHSMN